MALLGAALPTDEPLLRRNARMTKSAEQIAFRFQHLNDASLSTVEMTINTYTYNFLETPFSYLNTGEIYSKLHLVERPKGERLLVGG